MDKAGLLLESTCVNQVQQKPVPAALSGATWNKAGCVWHQLSPVTSATQHSL